MSFDYELPDGWCWKTIEEVQKSPKGATITGPFGSSIGKKFFVEKGVPVIRGNNLSLDMIPFIDDGFVYVSEKKADELKRYKSIADDLLFTAAGTIGQVGIIPKKSRYGEYIISNKQLRARLDTAVVDPTYAYYWFSSKPMVEYIKRQDTGSTIPLINLGVLRSLPLPVPPLAAQFRIRKILKSFDQKIWLNTQTNQTLEEMAQAIFKSWFVDFDPVRAKMRGEQPKGVDEATAALFPDKLVDSELGPIPEGWEVEELSKLFELHRGFDLPKSKRKDGDYPVYAAGGYHGTHNEFKMDPPGIITGRSGVIGNVFLSLDKYWPLNTTLYVRELRTCGPYYSYHLLRLLDLKALNSGSAVPSLNRNFVHSTNVCHPGSAVLTKFEDIVTPLFEKIVANNGQNRSLTKLRDTLLPKLLSGKIDLNTMEAKGE